MQGFPSLHCLYLNPVVGLESALCPCQCSSGRVVQDLPRGELGGAQTELGEEGIAGHLSTAHGHKYLALITDK